MAIYRLRYFFDFGSCVCLWSANEAAYQRFGDYPIPSSELPVSQTLKSRVEFVVSWYDTFLDWDNAPQPSRWSEREEASFNSAAQELLDYLREELGADFEVVDESKTTSV